MENKAYISAFMSSSIGLLSMSIVNIGTDANDGFKSLIHGLGKMWIPGADGIGPYSGKETVASHIRGNCPRNKRVIQ